MKHDLVVLALILLLFPLTLLVSARPLTLDGLRGSGRIAGWTARGLIAAAVTTLAIHIFDFARVADLKSSGGNVGLDIPSAASTTATEGLFQAGMLIGLGILLYIVAARLSAQLQTGAGEPPLAQELIGSPGQRDGSPQRQDPQEQEPAVHTR
jgi:hypothetical protein